VRGYALMKGYDGDAEGTAQVIHADGWLHTGDLGIMREDGCIHLTGRSRDVIIRGGENIYPREVEEFLYTHPKVDEAQVVGIPMRGWARLLWRGCGWRRARKLRKRRLKSFAKARSPITKFPNMFASSPSFPPRSAAKSKNTKIREFEIEARGLQSVANAATA